MATFSYPGVYIEEVPSGVHTITGVATSIAAFVGWANMGPTDHAVLVQSWSEFANQFGGVTNNGGQPNYLGYAVNQFLTTAAARPISSDSWQTPRWSLPIRPTRPRV